VELRILGPIELEMGGEPVEIAGVKQRSLLAALAVRAGEVVSADQLVEAVWGEALPANPRNALQIQVGHLRRRLGAGGRERLRSRAPGYVLDLSPEEFDVVRFERLVVEGQQALAAGDPEVAARRLGAALSLWRGPALEEFAQAPFAAATVARLEELRLAAAEVLIEARLRLGRPAEVVPELERLVRQHPLRERLRGQLMVALHRTGRQADALAVYQETRRILAEELGVDPTQELQELHTLLLQGDHGSTGPPRRGAAAAEAAEPPGPRAGAGREPGNLPVPMSTFVGRHDELDRIVGLLSAGPLLSLVGPGGVGKSRLAIEAARRLVGDGQLPGGVWFVELGSLADPALVVPATAAAVGLSAPDPAAGPDGGVLVRRVAATLAARPSLLVLDNCEHLVDATSRFVGDLLGTGEPVSVLCTSREALGLHGETVWSVPSLRLPGPAVHTPAQVGGTDAVRLFVTRARQFVPDFALDERSAPLVAELCHRLDGIPLALELAAARLRLLGLPELTQRLSDRFRILTAGERTAQPRQRTLRAVVDWSWDLLDDPERRLFRRLAVFAGTFTLAAVEEVCSGPEPTAEDVVEVLGRLVDKSLVVPRTDPDRLASYRLLETLRSYALERLREAGEEEALRTRHADHLLHLAGELGPRLRRAEQVEALPRLDAALDDVRTALEWLRQRDETGRLAHLAVALGWYWYLSGHRREGARWLEGALSVDEPLLRATVPVWHALLALDQYPVSVLRPRVEDAIRQVPAPAPLAVRAFARFVGAVLATEAGDHAAADAHLAAARSAAEEQREPGPLVDVDVVEAMRTMQRGRLKDGASDLTQGLARLVRTGDRLGQVHGLLMLAQLDGWSGSSTSAVDRLRRAVELASELHLRDLEGLAAARLATALAHDGALDAASEVLAHARRLAGQLGSDRLQAHGHHAAAVIAEAEGELSAARGLYAQVLTWFARGEQPVVEATLQHHLGALAELEGDLAAAADLHLRGVALARDARRLPLPPEMFTAPTPQEVGGPLPLGLEGLATTVAAAGHPMLAAELLGAAALRRPLGASDEPLARRARALAQAGLPAADRAAAEARGSARRLDDLLEAVREVLVAVGA
jgi:predicted ATPase/DNA-binding SARP family transcriptional activator